jgi:hypothetical protein
LKAGVDPAAIAAIKRQATPDEVAALGSGGSSGDDSGAADDVPGRGLQARGD